MSSFFFCFCADGTKIESNTLIMSIFSENKKGYDGIIKNAAGGGK